MPTKTIGCWYNESLYPGIAFDGDYKMKNGKRQFKLESVSGKKKRRTYKSFWEAKKKGRVLIKRVT